MSDNNPSLLPYPSRIDIAEEIRLHMAQVLSQTLACTLDLRSQLKQASWNVKGQAFYSLHELFTRFAMTLDKAADQIAERIAILGGAVRGTVRFAADNSTVQEHPDNITDGNEYMDLFAERAVLYIKAVRNGITLATDVDDASIAALYTVILRELERHLWILETQQYG